MYLVKESGYFQEMSWEWPIWENAIDFLMGKTSLSSLLKLSKQLQDVKLSSLTFRKLEEMHIWRSLLDTFNKMFYIL